MAKSVHKKLSKLYLTAIQEYNLIENGDKILVGLSGGKDSLALMHMLSKSLSFPKLDIEVYAVHISMNNIDYGVDMNYLQTLCDNYSIPFVHKVCSFEESETKDVCFLCSWTRRKAMFELAKELGCNKIALGHHKDDILETMLMNLMFQGSFSSMPPILKMDKFSQTIIRPLCLMEEDDIVLMAKDLAFPKTTKLCPYEKQSKRVAARNILDQMAEISEDAKGSMWRAMENIKVDHLPKKV